MSKAVIGAIEIGAAIAATAWVGGIGGLAAVAANGGMVGAMYAGATASLALSGLTNEAGAIAQALGSNQGLGTTTRSPAAYRQIIRGEQRVGGTIVYCSTTGSTKRQYNLVIALASHEIDSIVNLYLDGRQVFWQNGSNGNITRNGVNFGGTADPGQYIGPNGQKYSFGSEVFCHPYFGDQTALNGVCADLTANDGTWGASSVAAVGQATAQVSYNSAIHGEIDSVQVINPGYGYSDSSWVNVDIEDLAGLGSGASAHAVAAGGYITSTIVVDNPGRGYVNPTATIAAPDNPTIIGPTSQTPYLGGCAYVYLKLEADTATFPQFPEIRFTVRGKNDIYDPRTGTTGYTNNWALHIADAITDVNWGLGDNSVNQNQLIAAANVCDEYVSCAAGAERRYALNWHYDTSIAPGDVIAQMMDCAAGRLSRIGGEWFIWPAYWQGPSTSFDESSLISGLSWTPKRPMADLCNRITGTYIAANFPYNVAGDLYDSNGYWNGQMQNNFPFSFQPSNYPMYACDALHGYGTGVDVYLQQDGGIYLPKEVTQPCVLSISQAQRVAKIMLLRNRQQGSGTLTMGLNAWQMQPADVFNFSMPSLNWTNKVLEVSKMSLKQQQSSESGAPGYYVEVDVQETDPSVYEWEPQEELTPYDVPVSAAVATSQYIVSPPTNVTLADDATTASILQDGTTTSRVLVSWTPPVDTYVQNGGSIQVQYCLYSTSGTTNPITPIVRTPIHLAGLTVFQTNWVDAGSVNGQATFMYLDVPAGYCNISVQIRSVRSNGTSSAWVQDQATFGNAPITILRPQPVLPIRPIAGGGVVMRFPSGNTLDALEPAEAGADSTLKRAIVYSGTSESVVPNGTFILGNIDEWFHPEGTGAFSYGPLGNGSNGLIINGGGSNAMGSATFQVVPGRTYRITYNCFAGPGTQYTLLRVNYSNTYQVQITAANRSGATDFIAGGSIATTLTAYTYDWVCPAGVQFASLALYAWNSTTANLYVAGVTCVPYGAAGEWGANVTENRVALQASNLNNHTLDHLGDGSSYARIAIGHVATGGIPAYSGGVAIDTLKPLEAGAEKTTGKDFSVLAGRTADKLSYTAGGTVDSLKPAQAGADVTAGKSVDVLTDGTSYARTAKTALNPSGGINLGSSVHTGVVTSARLGSPNSNNLIPNPNSNGTAPDGSAWTAGSYEVAGLVNGYGTNAAYFNPPVNGYFRLVTGSASAEADTFITAQIPCNPGDRFSFGCNTWNMASAAVNSMRLYVMDGTGVAGGWPGTTSVASGSVSAVYTVPATLPNGNPPVSFSVYLCVGAAAGDNRGLFNFFYLKKVSQYGDGTYVDDLRPAESGAEKTTGKSIDILADGSTYHRMPAANMDGTTRRALIDFSQAHVNNSIDYVGDGTSYARVSTSHVSGGVPTYGDHTAIDSLRPAALGADVTGSNTANDVQVGGGRAVAQHGADVTGSNTANDVAYGAGKAVAQHGADVTGSNTSANTNSVSGLAAASVAGNLNGTHILSNPDFINGLTGWNVYNNSYNGNVVLGIVADSTAPNSSGQYLQINYQNNGVGVIPGWGGFYCAIGPDSGTAQPNTYHRGATIIWRIIANIPVGYTLNWASNAFGDGSSYTYLTPMTGTGNWQVYVVETGIGTTGTFSSIGYFYLQGQSYPANWKVAVVEAIDITAPTVVYTGNNVRSSSGSVLHDGDVITSQGTAGNTSYVGARGASDIVGTIIPGGGIDFGSGLHSNKHLGNIPDGGGRYGAAEAAADKTSNHILTSVVRSSDWLTLIGPQLPIPGLGWTTTTSSANDVYNIVANMTVFYENTSQVSASLGVYAIVDGNVSFPASYGTIGFEGGVSAQYTCNGFVFLSLTGLSVGQHTIQLYANCNMVDGFQTYGQATCQRIY